MKSERPPADIAGLTQTSASCHVISIFFDFLMLMVSPSPIPSDKRKKRTIDSHAALGISEGEHSPVLYFKWE